MLSEAIFTPSSKGYQGKVLDPPEYYIQIAIKKDDPLLKGLFDTIQGAAAEGFKNGEPARADFAWKFKDGDTNPERNGWAGCFVFTFRTRFTPNAIVDNKNQQIIDPHAIKPGYQVRVAYTVKANGNQMKPGVYLNFTMVQLVAEDTVIVSGPSVADVFGAPSAQTQPAFNANALPGQAAPAPARDPRWVNDAQPGGAPDYSFLQPPAQ